MQQSVLFDQKTELEMNYLQQMRIIQKINKLKQKIFEYNIMLKNYKSTLDLYIQTLRDIITEFEKRN